MGAEMAGWGGGSLAAVMMEGMKNDLWGGVGGLF